MTRVKRGFKGRTRRKRILDITRGFRLSRGSLVTIATHVGRKSLVYAYRDRHVRRRQFRRLWVSRVNAAARMCGLKYSELINGLKKAGVEIDRSVLADLANTDQAAFAKIAEKAKAALK